MSARNSEANRLQDLATHKAFQMVNHPNRAKTKEPVQDVIVTPGGTRLEIDLSHFATEIVLTIVPHDMNHEIRCVMLRPHEVDLLLASLKAKLPEIRHNSREG